jgi:hypothetical protein
MLPVASRNPLPCAAVRDAKSKTSAEHLCIYQQTIIIDSELTLGLDSFFGNREFRNLLFETTAAARVSDRTFNEFIQ